MKKIVLLYTHILLISLCYSQNNDIHIHFRDRHNENVTAIAVHPSGKYFFTADKTGKIIMWRTSDYSYLKTISDGLGLPVRDLRTTKDGSILLVTEGMQGRGLSDKNSGRYALSSLYYESDTLAAYYPFTDKNPVKKNISCDILGHQSDDIILMAIYDNQEGTLYGFDNDFSKNSYFDYPLEKPVHKAAINTQKQWLAYTCNDLIENTSELFIMSYNTGERLFKKVFRDEILEVVFDDVNPALHIISYQQQNQSLVLYNYNLEKDELIQTDTYVTGLLLYPFVYTQKTDSLSIIIDTEYIEPVILKKENNTLKKIDFNFKANYSNSTAAALIPGTHHLIMWTQIHDYFGPNPELHVFDYQALIDIEKYAVRTLNNASGSFLPGNNWYIEGLEENTSQQLLSAPQKKFIKYYRGGTFSNRFGRLMLKDFMNINYGLELMDDTRFVVDKYSGILVFGAYQAQSLDLKYYLYDLIQNEIDSSFKVKIELHEPLCYRNKAKHILDAGLTSFEGTRDFAIVSPTKTFFYNSHYTHAELSLDGNFIMLCDTSSTVRIFEAGRKKALFEKKLDKMEHINLGAADESSFWLSFSYWDKEERGYFFKSILLEYKEGKYIEQVFPKTSILDIASKNNMFAVLFDNITSRMVFISEDKKLIFSGSELPESLSLNDETDRLMLNFNNGTIRIYDTQTMTLQGTMVHPDSRRHIILTPNGFFSANTDVTPYLYAENNGKIISFESIETLYNKPAEALSVFGQPDIYYTEMLQKTSDIRLKKNSYTSIYKGSHDSAPIIKKILYDGFENTSVSSKKELALNIEFTDSLKGTIHLEIKINGSIVLEKDVTAHTDSFSRIINCEVALVSGENILSVWLTNARGIQSEASEHFILCTADDYTADLYLLAIGVSDYQDNAFNLTFAEKDAMDLSLLYGDTSSVPDVHTFKHKFFGERFTVNIFNKPKRDEEIRYLTEQYGENHFFSNIHQLDYSGYYWIENTDSLYFLWDFKNKNRKRIILPEFNYSSWSLEPLYIPSATDDGFFFKNETGEWFKYIFSENKTVKTNFTKNLKFFYLYDESWITDTIVYDNSAYNSWVSFYDKNGALKKQVTVEFEGLISPELLATSKDGSLLLFAIYNELWLVDVRENNIKKTKIENISHEMYNNTYFFDKNNESLTCLQKIYEEEGSSYNFYTYDMAKAKLKKEYFKYAFNTYNGINNIDGILKWIDISPPVGKKKDFYFKDYITEYSTLKPVSFKNVHIKTLTNEKANKENIIRELNSFYSTAAPNDQIILFLAGHGVLDTNLNFCFAPYDMDFKNPHKYGLEYSAIISYLKKIKAVRKLLIMDSCHSGDIFEKEDKQLAVNQTSDKDKRGVTALSYDNSYEEKVSEIMAQLFDNTSSQNGITVFSASAGTDVAYESKILSNGAFTTAFIANIENVFKDFLGNIDTKKQQPLSLTDNFIYELQKTVISSTQNKQLPNVREFNKLSGIRLW